MSAGSWIMLLFGCVLLYGGLAICLFKAAGSKTVEEEDENNASDSMFEAGE